jgi:hypothetical protein
MNRSRPVICRLLSEFQVWPWGEEVGYRAVSQQPIETRVGQTFPEQPHPFTAHALARQMPKKKDSLVFRATQNASQNCILLDRLDPSEWLDEKVTALSPFQTKSVEHLSDEPGDWLNTGVSGSTCASLSQWEY